MTAENLIIKFEKQMNEIMKWNEETFPDATLAGQLAKLEEEFDEYYKATTPEEEMKELADVFIVLAGLRRWDSIIGTRSEKDTLYRMPLKLIEELHQRIQGKMEINKERTRKGVWKKQPDGSYHH